MALFDPSMFNPQSFQGVSGLMGGLFPYKIPQSTGFAPQERPAPQQAMDMSARSQTPPAPLTAAPPAPSGPLFAPQAQEPSLSDRLQAFAHNPSGSHGLIPKLLDAFTGLSTGVRTDPQGIAIQQLNATYDALKKSGVPDATARAAALNPEILKTVAGAYFDTKPQFGVIGQNQMGVNQYGFIQPNQQKVTPVGADGNAGSGVASGGIDPSLTGDEFLKAVSDNPQLGPGKANMIKAIAEGRAPYPSGFLLKTPFGQWLTTALGQYKPDLTAQDYATIAATRKNYTSGPSFQEIKAINTAIGHASKLYDISQKMGGSDIAPGYVNPIIQGVKNNFPSVDPGFQDAKKQYDALSETLATEISKALNGGTPHVADKEHWRQIFSNADGPQQRTAAISAAMAILEGRTTPLKQGYEQGMKSAGAPINIISPENQQTFDRLLHGGRGAAPSSSSGPKVGDVQQGYRFKGGDPSKPESWEKQ